MKKIMTRWTLLLIVCAPVIMATGQPATGPSTAPATTRPTAATTLSMLPATNPSTAPSTTRTITQFPDRRFARVGPTASAPARAVPRDLPREFAVLTSRSIFVHGRMRIASTEPGTNGFTAPVSYRPEQSLIFDGATMTDSEFVAFIEDLSAGRVKMLRVGDPVARGRVGAITLDTLDYDVAGKLTHVMIGQNLDGIKAVIPTTQAVSSDGTGPTTGPAGSTNDILERLRQKRLQELGGK